MKKIKIFTMLICIVTVICAIAVSSNAKWWDENPFTDVKSSHWYYDAVRIANENGIFNGTSENKYSPSVKMTRAMLVKALANLDGYTEEYKGTTPFTDVKSNHWFATAVEWAYETKVTSGKTDTTFAPNENITREQLAAMLYRYAEYKGMTIENSKDISEFPDASKVSTYAVENLKWAYGNGIVNGSKSGDKLYLNPRNPATRAECATMFSKYLYLEPVYEINGNDISLYTIVYNANEIESVAEAANDLAKYIEMSIGYKLPVVTDEAEVGEYEILVGKTNREEKGLITVDRAAFTDDQNFLCQVQGNYLVITGIDTDAGRDDGSRTTFNIDGSQNAVIYFLEKEFGLNFYYKDEGTYAEADPVISLNDGYEYIDGPSFETRTLYIHSAGDDSYLDCGYYYSDWGCGLPHQLGNLMTGAWRHTYENTWDTPCLSSPENIESLLKNIRELLAEKPNVNLVGLIQNDSQNYCRCSLCAAAYREEGTRGGALIRLLNIVGDTFEEEQPNVKFATWAYNWSIKPPESDTTLHKNILLHYNTLHLCPAHEYSDTTCEFNKESAEHIKKWGEIVDKLYLWEHTAAFSDSMTPFPDFDSILPNAKYFADNGCEGVFLNSMVGRSAELLELRAYLFAHVYRDPYMTEEEYYYRMDGFLKAFYGDGWKSIREYIDRITELGNEKHHSFHAGTSGFYDYEHIREVIPTFEKLWDEAEAGAKTPEQLEHIQVSRTSWTYLKQCALYDTQFKNGTDEQKKAYENENQKLVDMIRKYGIHIGENYDGDYDLNISINPENWSN
ncbi:MAG: DUF4838 domain-containing protein [Clostridia bacterium]|nr:DUF4838 domain-containing protein [Clostridia bacterium]